jgi:hypothetical protein
MLSDRASVTFPNLFVDGSNAQATTHRNNSKKEFIHLSALSEEKREI